jgi:photosystem II stability/assembly factor-like uncharacterized protein
LERAVPRLGALIVLLVALAPLQASMFGQQRPPRKGPPEKVPARAAATQPAVAAEPKLKGIWEPVNYKEDVEFTDVVFVTPDVGWAIGYSRSGAGEGGVMIHTRDGGQSWEVQLGDSHSATRGFEQLRFIDETHGWATQFSGKIVRTTDGETWEEIGSYPTLQPYAFATPALGVSLDAQRILRTEDGGRTWKPVFTCQTKIEVEGLMREVGCNLAAVHFASPTVGYAVSGALPNRASAIVKTQDGGASWSISSFLPEGDALAVFFLDENTGFVKSYDKLFATSDGGQTWRGVAVAVPAGTTAKIKFADPEVGWICIGNQNSSFLTYTTDGGKRWNARDFRLPTGVNAFSLPRRDRAYVVGGHGMIYRYRVVPANYTAARAIDAPTMPSVDTALATKAEQLETQVQALQAEVSKAQAAGTTAGAASSGGEGGFVQDCCGEKLDQLQSTADSFTTELPKFSGKYRNLNLIFSGFRLIGQLFGQVQGLKDSFSALRKSRDPQAVSTVLSQLTSQIEGLVSNTKTAFQKPQ